MKYAENIKDTKKEKDHDHFMFNSSLIVHQYLVFRKEKKLVALLVLLLIHTSSY